MAAAEAAPATTQGRPTAVWMPGLEHDLPGRAAVARETWRGAKRLTAGAACAAFPLVFVLDGRTAWPLSPVLPGLAVLALAIAGLPPLVFLAKVRRLRRRAAQAPLLAAQFAQRARWALGAGLATFLGWLALGV